MPKSLEEVVKKIFTFKPSYPWSMECTDVSHAIDLDTEDSICYRVTVTVTEDSGAKENYDNIFFVPKLVRGSLELGGRKKQSIYTALGDMQIRIYSRVFGWGTAYSGTQKFDFSCRENKIQLQEPFDKVNREFGQVHECAVSNFLKYWEKWHPEYAYWFHKDDLFRADQAYQADIPAIEYINKNLVIAEGPLQKLRFIAKNPELPNKLTPAVVDAFINIIENDEVLSSRPTPMDYKFLDTYEALATSLEENYAKPGYNDIRSHVIFNMSKNGTFRISRLQTKIDDFFAGAKNEQEEKDEYSNIQEFTDTNALSVAELNSKIYFETYSYEAKGHVKQRLNPQYFVGIIDPVFTADSNQVNIKNELSIDASIREGKIYVKVLDKKFNEVELNCYDYLMAGTLSGDNIDYVNKKYFPVNGRYSIYKYGEYTEVVDEDEFMYLRKEDSVLTDSTSMIPFINRTQSMRSMLGAHMLTQAIPVNGAQPMFINTGKGKELYNRTALNTESKVDGTVTALSKDFMKITTDAGKSVIVRKPETYNTANHTSNIFSPSVSVGDKVKQGQTIYECNSFKDKDLALGVPLLVAYCSYHGREHEDAMVLRKEAALKFTHKALYKLELEVSAKENWLFGSNELKSDSTYVRYAESLDDLGFIKIGKRVDAYDVIMAYEKVVPEYSERARVAKLLDPSKVLVDNTYVEVPAEVTDGIVTSITFTPTKGAKTKFAGNPMFNTIISHVNELEDSYLKAEAETLGVSVKELKRPTSEYYSSDPEVMGTLTFNILYDNFLKKSDKMSNYYGSKGVVSTIVEDDKMLRTEDGRIIDIVISPLSVISRINISQLYVASLGLISKTLYQRLETFFSNKEVDKAEEELLKGCVKDLMYKQPKISLKEVYEKSKPYQMVQIDASAFDKYFTDEIIKSLESRLGIKDREKLYDPTTGRWTQIPIRIGYQDFLRLHFIAEHKMKVTGTGKRQRVVKGYGEIRHEGQSIGEQESWSLMSYGDLDLLHKFSHEREDKAARFSQEMLSVGLLLNKAGQDVL